MVSVLILLLASSSLTALIIPVIRRICLKHNLVDYRNSRKIHNESIPRLGGIGIAISFFLCVILGYLLFRPSLNGSKASLIGLSLSGSLVLLLGIWDDIRGLNAKQKATGQTAIALILIPFGFMVKQLTLPFVGTVHLHWVFGLIPTIIWLIGFTNAMNLIDGMDGLAAGVAFITSLILSIISFLNDNMLISIVMLVLAGSTLGFLLHNFHPAKIFMGDCGAMFIGFLLSAASIKIFYHNPVSGNAFAPIFIMGLPIIDTTWAMARRFWNKKYLFSGDKGHIHHRLLNLGFGQRKAALLLYAVSLTLGGIGFIAARISNPIAMVAIIFLTALSIIVSLVLLARKSPFRQSETLSEYGERNKITF